MTTKIFLDSGAFTAYRQNDEIHLQDYIDFIKENSENIAHYMCLDVIRNPEETWLNQKEMERQGLKPIVVFHKKEDYSWLRRYIRHYDYVALGGVAGDLKIEETERHFDRCWDIICDTPDRLPRVRIHGLGVTINRMLFKYPWHSVDSSMWIQTSRRGIILLPRFSHGKNNFIKPPRRIEVSSKSPHKKKAMAHYETLSPMEKREVRRYVEGCGCKMGKSEFDKEGNETIIEVGVSNTFRERDKVNYVYMHKLQEALPKKPFAFRSGNRGMFSK